MSVLIKGIEMPKSCVDCPCSLNMFFCRALDGREVTDRTGIEFKEDGIVVSRPDWCPLVEAPGKHGQLIDVDAFKTEYGMKNDCADCEKEMHGKVKACEYDRIYSKMDFCGWLDDAPTVIEGSDDHADN